MMYSIPLAERMVKAEQAKARYWADPRQRLRRINAYRRRKGLPTLERLEDMRPSRKHQPPRDASGRFVPQGAGRGNSPGRR